MIGETVIVEKHKKIGANGHRQPIYEWVPETVDDVLVAPGPRADIPDTARPEGVVVAWTLHFPKTFAGSLEGAQVRVRGGEPCMVIGDPQPYTMENTPTRWNRPVEVKAVKG